MQRRIDEYQWDALRRALQDLREETHLTRTRFSDVYGLARTTVEKVEKIDKWPDYTPFEDTIRRWLEATSGEELHLFMRRFSTEELDGPAKSPTMPVPVRTGGAAVHDRRALSPAQAIAQLRAELYVLTGTVERLSAAIDAAAAVCAEIDSGQQRGQLHRPPQAG